MAFFNGNGRTFVVAEIIVGILGIAATIAACKDGKAGYGILVAGAFFLAGGLAGLLFGIPRVVKGEGAGSYAPNTNLEEISDWLTKIIVGVGLTQINGIIAQTRVLVHFLARGFGGDANAVPLAFGIAAYFLPVGFIVAYLLSRTVLFEELARLQEQKKAGKSAGKSVEGEIEESDSRAPELVDDQSTSVKSIE